MRTSSGPPGRRRDRSGSEHLAGRTVAVDELQIGSSNGVVGGPDRRIPSPKHAQFAEVDRAVDHRLAGAGKVAKGLTAQLRDLLSLTQVRDVVGHAVQQCIVPEHDTLVVGEDRLSAGGRARGKPRLRKHRSIRTRGGSIRTRGGDDDPQPGNQTGGQHWDRPPVHVGPSFPGAAWGEPTRPPMFERYEATRGPADRPIGTTTFPGPGLTA